MLSQIYATAKDTKGAADLRQGIPAPFANESRIFGFAGNLGPFCSSWTEKKYLAACSLTPVLTDGIVPLSSALPPFAFEAHEPFSGYDHTEIRTGSDNAGTIADPLYTQIVADIIRALGTNQPSGLVAVTASSSQINLTWVDNSVGEEGFIIDRAVGGSTSFSDIARVDAEITGFADSDLSPNTEYSYRVRSFKGSYLSSYSNVASTTTQGAAARLVASIGSIPDLLRNSGDYLYFTQGYGALDRYIGGINLSGGPGRAGGLVGVAAMATVRDSVYWVSDYFQDKGIRKNTLIGGTSQTVTTLASNLGLLNYKADCFTSDGSSLFYIAEVEADEFAIQKVSLDGQSSTSLASISGQGACTVSGSEIFFADRGAGEIRRVQIAGNAPSILVASVPFDEKPSRMIVYGTFLILTDDQSVRTISLSDGTLTTRFSGPTAYTPPVLDGTTLYFNQRLAGNYPDFQPSGGCLRISVVTWTASIGQDVGCIAVNNSELFWWDRSPPDNSGGRGWWLLAVDK